MTLRIGVGDGEYLATAKIYWLDGVSDRLKGHHSKDTSLIGIDPGSRNIGIYLYSSYGQEFGVKLSVNKVEDRIDRMINIQRCVNHVIDYVLRFESSQSVVTIEGASFGAPHGQVELAEARAAIALLFSEKSKRVSIIPPLKIRKTVFGSGKIKNLWTNIPDDVAAAIGCAYYPIMFHQL